MQTIINILTDGTSLGLIWSLMALGVFISFRVLDFADLTVEGSITLGSNIAVMLILANVPAILATIIAIIGGFASGIITGLLHTKLKIPAILSGIITLTALYTINLSIMGGAHKYLGSSSTIYTFFREMISNQILAKILTTFIVVLIVFYILYWFFGTEIGMSIRATGMNQKMAKAQGINTDLKIILGLAIGNALIALSGALYAQSSKGATMDFGKGTIVVGLSAIIIGEGIFGKRSFRNCLISVILGSIVYQLLIGIAISLDLNPDSLKILIAALITIILAYPLIKQKYKSKQKNKEAMKHA